MKVVSFTVKNYRSIVEAHKIMLNDYNVLLGKNNEGKSNILRALSVCMSCINDYRHFRFILKKEYQMYNKSYLWENDFPINLRNRKNGRKSIFELELYLDENELLKFNRSLHTRIRVHNISMRIEIDENNIVNVTFPLRGTNSLTNKKERVLEFLSDKITYNYIPAIRTENQAIKLIKNNIATELEILNNNQEYIKSLNKIRSLQEVYLNKIANNIKNELKEFLPKVNNVKIEIEDDYRIATAINNINVYVDDGVLTNIENKGDGVKSLAVLAMLKNRQNNNESSSIVAIDEPEAHLHPGAINELSNTLKELSKNNQVIISTHNQLFTNYLNLNNNIIIDNGKAKPAKTILEIKNILGVRSSDNMVNARFIVLVEGKTDEKILNYIFQKRSLIIKKAIQERTIMIYSIEGASKLEYNASRFKKDMCICLALIDNDNEGRTAANKVIKNSDVAMKNLFLCNCKGMSDSELEDCINPTIYKESFLNKYGVDLSDSKFRNNKKWSIRIKETFESQCKLFNDEILIEAKKTVMDRILELDVDNALIKEKSAPIINIINRIEELLNNYT